MKAKKNLGQNFLIDKNVINKIGNEINAQEDDLIIEIGPGMGALTEILQEKGANIICYEVDTDLRPYLNKLENEKTKIIYKDILTVSINDDISDIKYNNLFIVGNLPYYITTPIIKHIISLNLPVSEMVFMVQDEVANRFSSLPNSKEYGSITLYLKYYFDVKKVFKVSKNSFNPIPKVESAILKFTRRINKPIVDKNMYFKLIDDSFKMKRKTLKNNLVNYDFNKIENVLKKHNISSTARAEELSEDVFVEIANNLK